METEFAEWAVKLARIRLVERLTLVSEEVDVARSSREPECWRAFQPIPDFWFQLYSTQAIATML